MMSVPEPELEDSASGGKKKGKGGKKGGKKKGKKGKKKKKNLLIETVAEMTAVNDATLVVAAEATVSSESTLNVESNATQTKSFFLRRYDAEDTKSHTLRADTGDTAALEAVMLLQMP